MSIKNDLEALNRRRAFLKTRVENAPHGLELTYDKHEYMALTRVISLLEKAMAGDRQIPLDQRVRSAIGRSGVGSSLNQKL